MTNMSLNSTRRRWSATAACVASLTLLIAGCSNPGSAATSAGESSPADGVYNDTVTVGMSTDVTGPAAANLAPYWHGAQAYFDGVNAGGGIHGRTINMMMEDDKTDATLGVAAYRKFVNQEPALVMMGTTTAIQAAIARQGDNTALPVVGPLTVAQPFINPFNPSFYSLACTYGDQADVALAYMIKESVAQPKVYIVRSFNASGEEWTKLLTERVKMAGGTVVGEHTLENGALDEDILAQGIASTKPDMILAHGATASGQTMFKSFEKFGLTGLNIGTTSVLQDPVIPQAGASTFNSYYSFDCYQSPSQGGEAGKAVIKAAEAAGFTKEQYDRPQFTQGYIAAQVVAKAIDDAGESPTREKLMKALDGLSKFDTGGLSPTISFSADNHSGVKGMLPFKYDKKSKAFSPVGNYTDYAACITNYYVTQSSANWSPTCIK